MSLMPIVSFLLDPPHTDIPLLTCCQGQIAVEAFTCLLVFKNIFSFFLTYFAYDWLVEAGARKVFLIIASIQVGVCLLSVPMCKCNTLLHQTLLFS